MLFRYQLGKTQRHPLPRPFFAVYPERASVSGHRACWGGLMFSWRLALPVVGAFHHAFGNPYLLTDGCDDADESSADCARRQ